MKLLNWIRCLSTFFFLCFCSINICILIFFVALKAQTQLNCPVTHFWLTTHQLTNAGLNTAWLFLFHNTAETEFLLSAISFFPPQQKHHAVSLPNRVCWRSRRAKVCELVGWKQRPEWTAKGILKAVWLFSIQEDLSTTSWNGLAEAAMARELNWKLLLGFFYSILTQYFIILGWKKVISNFLLENTMKTKIQKPKYAQKGVKGAQTLFKPKHIYLSPASSCSL